MAEQPVGLGVDNAIAWVQFRLRGGWKNVLIVGAGYVALIGMLMFLTVQIEPKEIKNIMYGWTIGLMALQCGTLMLVAGSSVRTAIRKDVDSQLIESHRLMPVSGFKAVAGYVIGCSAQSITVALANVALGMIATAAASLSIADWVMANAVLLFFAFTSWVVIAFLSLVSKSAFALILVLVIVATFSQGVAFQLLPGISVLMGPMIGKTIFGISSGGFRWGTEYMVSLFTQALLVMFFMVGAARKYRRNDIPAFGPYWGLGLVALWVVLSIMGISYWGNIGFAVLPRWTREAGLMQLIASILVAILAAIVPVSSVAWLHSRWERRRALGDPDLPRRPVAIMVVVAVASLLILLLPCGTVYSGVWSVAAPVGSVAVMLVPLASLIGIGYLMAACYRQGKSALIITLVWIATIWLLPLLVDLTRYQVLRYNYQTGRGILQVEPAVTTFISRISPIGILLAGYAEAGDYRDWVFNPIPGLGIQFLLAAAMVALYHVIRQRAAGSPADTQP
ncbi:MAG: hypothetical protein KA354_09980 [Phycisphaerae bacterium]|nr:hypothetical protein [Phycisphaerae bacterium]